jgi:hypothetical protein
MYSCDLCGKPVEFATNRYTCGQFKDAVARGLRPDATAFELGAAFGLSREETERKWLQNVWSNTTDWILCNVCDSRYDTFAFRLQPQAQTVTTTAYSSDTKARRPAPVSMGPIIFGIIFGVIALFGLVFSYMMASAQQRHSDKVRNSMGIPPPPAIVEPTRPAEAPVR